MLNTVQESRLSPITQFPVSQSYYTIPCVSVLLHNSLCLHLVSLSSHSALHNGRYTEGLTLARHNTLIELVLIITNTWSIACIIYTVSSIMIQRAKCTESLKLRALPTSDALPKITTIIQSVRRSCRKIIEMWKIVRTHN